VTYRVDVSEAAEAEIDAAYLWVSRHSPEWAGRWHFGLLEAIASLSEMPGRCPLAPESGYFEDEVRQLLYGRGRNIFRILFAVHQAEDGEEATVRILHVRHAAQRAIGEGDEEKPA
jgi:plasmid stabilization system protein ParE